MTDRKSRRAFSSAFWMRSSLLPYYIAHPHWIQLGAAECKSQKLRPSSSKVLYSALYIYIWPVTLVVGSRPTRSDASSASLLSRPCVRICMWAIDKLYGWQAPIGYTLDSKMGVLAIGSASQGCETLSPKILSDSHVSWVALECAGQTAPQTSSKPQKMTRIHCFIPASETNRWPRQIPIIRSIS